MVSGCAGSSQTAVSFLTDKFMSAATFGPSGILSEFDIPFVKHSVDDGLGVGSKSNPVAEARSTVVGDLRAQLAASGNPGKFLSI